MSFSVQPPEFVVRYVAEEKLAIASKYLVPQIEELTGDSFCGM